MTSQLEEKTLPSNDHSLVQAVGEGGSDGSPTNADGDDTPSYEYLQGLRFWLVTTSLAVMVFMVNLEITVVTTSLVTISQELGGFDKSSWVVSGYLLGYVAVIVVFAKLSDIFGRKPIYLLSMSFFIIFSAACSAAQIMAQL
ncbi:hypothetical protein LA080_013199 [Diaporthe eres]|uniref:Major facilitator superfamily (MFS) profile domain-containing protein n=1 Tax=Diaporthe vaccinii TaxID=105482 RepID=A0ABR4ESM1_9PEZI|nr:hypothetical protein LA080_013199 [Diaporthe eres]